MKERPSPYQVVSVHTGATKEYSVLSSLDEDDDDDVEREREREGEAASAAARDEEGRGDPA